jgi:hypothetical protein
MAAVARRLGAELPPVHFERSEWIVSRKHKAWRKGLLVLAHAAAHLRAHTCWIARSFVPVGLLV